MGEILDDIEDDIGSFTLQDAYDNLKDIKSDLEHEIDDLIEQTVNNKCNTLMESFVQDDIRYRHHKLMRGLLENLHRQEPRILPQPNTIDLRKTIIQDFTEVADDMQKIINATKTDIENIRKNIIYLKSNKAGLEKMKTACQEFVENVEMHSAYRKEIAVTKKLFNEVKADLYTCVDTIFPDNAGFKDLLANFTQAYTKGGDDVYVDVAPEDLTFAKFLIEADIAVYHRNDKSKIKMMDLL